MTGTTEMLVAYAVLSSILAYYVNHLRSRILYLNLQLNKISTESDDENSL